MAEDQSLHLRGLAPLTGVDETADPADVDPSSLKPNKEHTPVEVY